MHTKSYFNNQISGKISSFHIGSKGLSRHAFSLGTTLFFSLVCVLLLFIFPAGHAYATTSQEYQNQINNKKDEISNTKQNISDINDRIDDLESQQEILEEEIEDINAEIINTMSLISIKEDEITEKECDISDKEMEIADKQTAIEAAEVEYEAAVDRMNKQYDDMVVRVRLMYEHNTADIINLLFQGTGLSELLNRMDFVESIYSYDKGKLAEYTQMKLDVKAMWEQLEADKVVLEEEKANLLIEKEDLETQKQELEGQKQELDVLKAELKAKSADYDALIKKAEQEASVAAALLKQEQKDLKKLEAAKTEAERREQAAANNVTNNGIINSATNNISTTDYTSIIDGASGSDLGKKIAKYACQFVGNPYVAGGTSLTNGADCSGFTYRVYSDFGYTIPRTSYLQRSAGTAVDYANAQPGDLICYSGHVAMYIGGGKIVHASTAKTGIKIGNAAYRTILAVRRIVN